MSRYKKVFAAREKQPYLGPFPGMVHCSDVDALPKDATFAALGRKCKNLDALPAHSRLKRIHCELSDSLIEHLAEVPRLDYLQVKLPRTDKLPRFQPLRQIKTLVLRCNKHQSSLDFLKGMKNLTSLCISEAMGVSRLTPLANLENLRELYIDGTISGRNSVQSLAPIAKLKQLRYALLLLRVDEANRTLKHLLKLEELEFLHLSDDYDVSEYDKVIANLPKLKEIRFNGGMRWPS